MYDRNKEIADYAVKALKNLIGATVVKAITQDGFPVLVLEPDDAKTPEFAGATFFLTIMQDNEGNGPGAVDLQAVAEFNKEGK